MSHDWLFSALYVLHETVHFIWDKVRGESNILSPRFSDLLKMGRASNSKQRSGRPFISLCPPRSIHSTSSTQVTPEHCTLPSTCTWLSHFQPFHHSTTLIWRLKQIKHAYSLCWHSIPLVLLTCSQMCVCAVKLWEGMCVKQIRLVLKHWTPVLVLNGLDTTIIWSWSWGSQKPGKLVAARSSFFKDNHLDSLYLL